MKVHSPTELSSCLTNAIRKADRAVVFSIVSVEVPPHSCGLVSVIFELDGLVVRMDRDRGEIDFFVRQKSGGWKILSRYWERFTATGFTAPPLKTKELFDPGYSEDEAIQEGASALVAMRAMIAEIAE